MARSKSAQPAIQRFAEHLDQLVKVPAARIDEFVDSSALELDQQSELLDQVSGCFEQILAILADDPEAGRRAFDTVDIRLISRDHGWRDIFLSHGLNHPGREALLRVAMEKYLEYLRFRRRVVAFVRQRREAMHSEVKEDVSPFMATLRDAAGPETRCFDRPARELQGMASDLYRRLPKAEAVVMPIADDVRLRLVLASHTFTATRAGDDLELCDENGVRYYLPPGNFSVGRSRRCDVVVDDAFQEVSRTHLILEWDGEDSVTLTDISRLGTYIAAGTGDR